MPLVEIQSRDYWYKVTGMLQQNWALVEQSGKVFFINDASGVFDEMKFLSIDDAFSSLERNGFSRYAADAGSQQFLSPPKAPFKSQRNIAQYSACWKY